MKEYLSSVEDVLAELGVEANNGLDAGRAAELLEKNGAQHIWYEIPGADHDNTAIQSGLYNLFKQIANDKGSENIK